MLLPEAFKPGFKKLPTFPRLSTTYEIRIQRNCSPLRRQKLADDSSFRSANNEMFLRPAVSCPKATAQHQRWVKGQNRYRRAPDQRSAVVKRGLALEKHLLNSIERSVPRVHFWQLAGPRSTVDTSPTFYLADASCSKELRKMNHSWSQGHPHGSQGGSFSTRYFK